MNPSPSTELWDVIVIGGGPAGLSAALLLGRCRRRVLVFDDGRPRNARSHAAHGVFTRDGESPAELRRIARAQLDPYGVCVRDETVAHVDRRSAGGFELTTESGQHHRAKKLLLATGITDILPDIPGLQAIYGSSAFHCPYCDGWEVSDRRIAVLARGAVGVEYALGITTWSRDVVLCTHGAGRISTGDRSKLRAHGIAVHSQRIRELVHDAGQLQRIAFEDGVTIERDALFFNAPSPQRSQLAQRLGCLFTEKGAVKTGRLASTGGGLYVAGDAAREVHFVSVAAAEGLKAAFAINRELRQERSAELLNEQVAREGTREAARRPASP
ncbi:MAG TPA: NAD(P)/FAD-dependent oxidoreductase [Polyangiales bacterium]|nr:NAD(P)/FAD-dependent oxidoreductase [Polyangiales bacterium]